MWRIFLLTRIHCLYQIEIEDVYTFYLSWKKVVLLFR